METFFIIAVISGILLLNLFAFSMLQNRRIDKELQHYLRRTKNNRWKHNATRH